MLHQLKTWLQYFKQIEAGEKTFEVRKNDRDFKVGDTLELQEYDIESQSYTGRKIFANVTSILYGGTFGIDAGYCVMSLDKF